MAFLKTSKMALSTVQNSDVLGSKPINNRMPGSNGFDRDRDTLLCVQAARISGHILKALSQIRLRKSR